MFDLLRGYLLRWLRVPTEPGAPAGSAHSVRQFRAGRNFYKLSLLKWGFKQLAVAGSLVAAFTFFGPLYSVGIPTRAWPEWLRLAWSALEALAAIGFVVQLPFSYAAVRLSYEMRWYIVTDRSLRIRSGIWSVEELTMTFANIQQVNLTQGPLQRLLGIADLEVTSAGGGGRKHDKGEGDDSHSGRFAGVEDATAIRNLILERLRQYRDAGLGDPDEAHAPPVSVNEAAQEVLAEVRHLHRALARLPG
jgi:uncharacterized membrane protein YdbT with pleckstrin-like domain